MRLLNTFQTNQQLTVPTARCGQSGFAFIVVLGILLLVTGLAFVSFSTSDTDRQIASNNLSNSRAYYAAEAGVIRSTARLVDSLWREGYDSVEIGNATFSVQVVDSLSRPGLKDSLLLRASGNAQGTESRIDALLSRERNRIFRYAAFGDSSVDFGGNILLDGYNSDSGAYLPGGMGGDAGSNGDIHFNGNGEVYGDLTTPDTIITDGSVNVYGTANDSAATTTLDPITQAQLDYARLNSNAPAGLTFSGMAAYNPVTKALGANGGASSVTFNTSGIYFFSDISIFSNAKIIIPVGVKAIIYMTGNLQATGGSVVNTTLKPENLQIYSTGSNITINGTAGVYAAIYAPNANILISGSPNVYGSFVGKSLQTTGGGAMHYDRSLRKLENPLKPKFKVVSWLVL